MFTGIIKEIGTITAQRNVGGKRVLTIKVALLPPDVGIGDSVAIEGVCLTVINYTSKTFSVEAVEETIKRSTIGDWQTGTSVNIEYSLRLSDRIGGHIVQGHVDGIGIIKDVHSLEGSTLYSIEISEELVLFCIEKGSIAIDGISLTIVGINDTLVTTSIIPHTAANTMLGKKKVGSKVNVEVDLIGKYVKRFLEGRTKKSGITENFLKEVGFI